MSVDSYGRDNMKGKRLLVLSRDSGKKNISTYVYLVSLNQHMDFSFQPQQKSHNSSSNEIPVNSGKHMGLFMGFHGFSMNNSRMFQCQVSQAQDAMLHKPRPRRCHGMAGYHGMELTNYRIYMGFIWDLYGIMVYSGLWCIYIYTLVMTNIAMV